MKEYLNSKNTENAEKTINIENGKIAESAKNTVNIANGRNAETNKIIVRQMTREDILRAVEIESASFSEPWTEEIFSATLLLPYAHYYVAEMISDSVDATDALASGVIVAQCGIRDIFGEGEITNVAVDPAYRGMGISEILFEEALQDAMKLGIREFTLEVRAGNAPAIHLYEKFGFVTEGVRKKFYDKPVEDALIMWRREAGHDQ